MSDKIKSIKSNRFLRKVKSIMDKEISTVELPFSYELFDENGLLLESKRWGEDGGISEKFVYENADGKMIKETIFVDENEVGQTEFNTFDENGLLTEKTIEYSDGSKDTVVHSYDSNNNLLSIITRDDDGDVGQQEHWEYQNNQIISYKLTNDLGNIEEEEIRTYDSEGRLSTFTKINHLNETKTSQSNSYNSEGQLILEAFFNANDKPISETTYKYDIEGRISEELIENAKTSILRLHKYNEQGKEIETTQKDINKDELDYEVFRSFNDQGRITSSRVVFYVENEVSEGGYEIEYEYEYY